MCFLTSVSAENIAGVYKSVNPKEVSISILGGDKVEHPDKRGRFTLKNVDLSKDTMLIESPTLEFPIAMPIAHPQGAQYVSAYIITEKVVEDGVWVDFCYKPKPISLPTLYGGIVIKREDLESTGEQSVLSAVKVKYPQQSLTTFNGNTTPLYFVDGVETTDITGFPVRETAYVEYVSPTSSACASLGARGANGAILITTKTKFETTLGYKGDPEEKHIEIKQKGSVSR